MRRVLLLWITFAWWIVACGGAGAPPVQTLTAAPRATPTPEPTILPLPAATSHFSSDVVSFVTDDGLELSGTLFESDGDTAVVLAHMAGSNDQQNWLPFAKDIAARGFTALTFDFRCYGRSDCGGTDSGAVLLSRDMGAAIGFLRERGLQRIVCMGASMGGRGCVNAAFEQELAGLVIVSGTGSSDPDRQHLEDIVSPNMPKLFVLSKSDPTAGRTTEMTSLYESAPEPKVLLTFPGTAHGTELFDSRNANEFRNALLQFLEGVRSSEPVPSGAVRERTPGESPLCRYERLEMS